MILGLKEFPNLSKQGEADGFGYRTPGRPLSVPLLPTGGTLENSTEDFGPFRSQAAPGAKGRSGEVPALHLAMGVILGMLVEFLPPQKRSPVVPRDVIGWRRGGPTMNDSDVKCSGTTALPVTNEQVGRPEVRVSA
jgi:hypothetical protein